MPEVLVSSIIPASAEDAWRVIRDFNGLPTWHPAIEASELEGDSSSDQVGAVRKLALAGGGGEVREALLTLDDRNRILTYGILTSPFPVADYRSTIRVTPLTSTGEAFVAWSLLFDCNLDDSERLSAFFAGDVFEAGLRGLDRFLVD